MNCPRPVVFLDIDGVANSARYVASCNGSFGAGRDLAQMLDPTAIVHLNKIRKLTDCEFVLSSTWRLLNTVGTVNRALNARGFIGELIDRTDHDGPYRGDEIQRWLTQHTDVWSSFCILDDDSDMGNLKPFLVQTTWANGLGAEHVPMVVAKLQAAA